MPSCKNCGDEFIASRAWQEFCSPKCRNTFHNAKKIDESVRCPYCKSESDPLSPNIIEVIRQRSSLAPRQYLCNVCARVFDEVTGEPEHPPFTGLVDKNLK